MVSCLNYVNWKLYMLRYIITDHQNSRILKKLHFINNLQDIYTKHFEHIYDVQSSGILDIHRHCRSSFVRDTRSLNLG